MRRLLPIWVFCLSQLTASAQYAAHPLANCGNAYSVTASVISAKKGENVYQLSFVLKGSPVMVVKIGNQDGLGTREVLRLALVKQLKKKDLFSACPTMVAANDKAFDDLIDALVSEKFTRSHLNPISQQIINDNNILKLGQETGNDLYNISNYIKGASPVTVLTYNNGTSQYEFQWGALSAASGAIIRDNFETLVRLYSKLPGTTVAPKLYLQAVAGGYQVLYSYDDYIAVAPAPPVILRKEVAEKLRGDVSKTATLGGIGGLFEIKNPDTSKKTKDEPAFKE